MLFTIVGADRVPQQADISKRRIQQARFYASKGCNYYARKMFDPVNRPAAHVTDEGVRRLQVREYAVSWTITITCGPG